MNETIELERLQAENAAIRKLVAEMLEAAELSLRKHMLSRFDRVSRAADLTRFAITNAKELLGKEPP